MHLHNILHRMERRFAHRGFGRHHGHDQRHEGRGGRLLKHGGLRFLILRLIAEQPRNGYELIKAIEEKLGGAYSPSPGVIYPTLTLLEEMGYAAVSQAEGSRKLYAITESGRVFLDANRAEVEAVASAVRSVDRDSGVPRILSAMHRLRSALHHRVPRGRFTEADIDAIVRAIEAAALALETAGTQPGSDGEED
jgi:DNA-binding PadR family transcriptional regulator